MWSRFDDQITHHPKILKAGIRAAYFYFASIIYCSRYRTDGFIPKEALAAIAPVRDFKRLARTLVEVRVPTSAHGLWEEVEGGYRVHDFLAYQPSAAALAQREEADRKRLRAARGAGRGGAGDVIAASEGGVEVVEGEGAPVEDVAQPEDASSPGAAITTGTQPARRDDVVTTSRRHRSVPSPIPSPSPSGDRSLPSDPVCAPDPRAGAREVPDTHTEGRVERSNEPPAVAVNAGGGGEIADAVLKHMAAMPAPICHLATAEHAERFSAARLGGLAVDDICRAITAAGLKLGAHAMAGPTVPRSLVALADHVGRFVANQTPSPPAPSAMHDVEPAAVERFLQGWGVLYAKKEGSAYVTTEEERGHVAEIVRTAHHVASEQLGPDSGDARSFEARLLTHWMRAYLSDEGVNGYLVKARHPLRYLTRCVSTYGLPPAPRSARVSVPEPDTEPALSGRELADRGRQFLRVLDTGPGLARAAVRVADSPSAAAGE